MPEKSRPTDLAATDALYSEKSDPSSLNVINLGGNRTFFKAQLKSSL
jgi:hypothetical protein